MSFHSEWYTRYGPVSEERIVIYILCPPVAMSKNQYMHAHTHTHILEHTGTQRPSCTSSVPGCEDDVDDTDDTNDRDDVDDDDDESDDANDDVSLWGCPLSTHIHAEARCSNAMVRVN